MLRVIDIVGGTSVDGPGLRTSIYFAGCSHHCPGCHNPQTWDFAGGTEMSIDQIMERVREEGFNVTFSGGDPLDQPEDELATLAEAIVKEGYTIWCYTGYTYEQIVGSGRHTALLDLAEVLVDGPFVQEQRDTTLQFRGSKNQRIVRLKSQ